MCRNCKELKARLDAIGGIAVTLFIIAMILALVVFLLVTENRRLRSKQSLDLSLSRDYGVYEHKSILSVNSDAKASPFAGIVASGIILQDSAWYVLPDYNYAPSTVRCLTLSTKPKEVIS